MALREKNKETGESLSTDSIYSLIEQARWVVERYERTNEGLVTRLASLAGFAGVELSLIGTMVAMISTSTISTRSPSVTAIIFALIAFTSVTLLVSILLFLGALRAQRSNSEMDTESINGMLRYFRKRPKDFNRKDSDESVANWILDQILLPGAPHLSYAEELKNENKRRGNPYLLGGYFLLVAQIGLVVTVLFTYWSSI